MTPLEKLIATTPPSKVSSAELGFYVGAASRDAEIADLKVVSDHNLATYHKAAELLRAEVAELNKTILTMRDAAWELSKERDQLREQVTLLRDKVDWLRRYGCKDDLAFRVAQDVLIATEPKP